jgi:NAD/NADP transhydrogenase beta subunit
LLAETTDFINPQWATPSLLGVIVAGIIAFVYIMRSWTEERRSNNELQEKHAEQLTGLIRDSQTVIVNNTQAMASIVAQSQAVVTKLDDIRDRFLKFRCPLEANQDEPHAGGG